MRGEQGARRRDLLVGRGAGELSSCDITKVLAGVKLRKEGMSRWVGRGSCSLWWKPSSDPRLW